MLRDVLQELRELGARGTAFRASWELKKRSGTFARLTAEPSELPLVESGVWMAKLPFADPVAVVEAMRPRIHQTGLEALHERAQAAARGRLRCFGRWEADYGDPVDWHLNPTNGQRWRADALWSHVLEDEARVGDVKLTWEIARFPHAFEMARAAQFFPESASTLAAALLGQIESFVRENPYGRGVHWASGQETAIRLFAWIFALDVLLSRGPLRERAGLEIARALQVGARHIEHHLDYARIAVFNNHLLSEALGLYGAGMLLGIAEWRTVGRRLLVAECDRQFYADGAYIQQSHNYHRVALQNLLCAVLIARVGGEAVSDAWLRALDRSLSFLYQHQNPVDGRLPNYGGNDGALPLLLSTCDFSDFRPALQATSVLVRQKRLYEPGPWDESAAWFFGPQVLDLPIEAPRRRSISFGQTGYHVLRGNDEHTFAAFRCGTIRDRFSQIDMLHLDLWWRGLNLFVDGGSYLYNGPEKWHDHFVETPSHNTISVDGRDQMLHFRRFKMLYWTHARQLEFSDSADATLCAGEHDGYARHPGGCVHRRSVLFVKDDLWVVADTISGQGDHRARLHWLAGLFPSAWSAADCRLTLDTPEGPFSVGVFDSSARPLTGDVVSGAEDPPRGWLARYYGERVPVPSLAVERSGSAPLEFISVLGAGQPTLAREGSGFVVQQGSRQVRFSLRRGLLTLAQTGAT